MLRGRTRCFCRLARGSSPSALRATPPQPGPQDQSPCIYPRKSRVRPNRQLRSRCHVPKVTATRPPIPNRTCRQGCACLDPATSALTAVSMDGLIVETSAVEKQLRTLPAMDWAGAEPGEWRRQGKKAESQQGLPVPRNETEPHPIRLKISQCPSSAVACRTPMHRAPQTPQTIKRPPCPNR